MILLFAEVLAIVSGVMYDDERSLLTKLLKNYDNRIRPAFAYNDTVNVTFKLYFNQILDVVSCENICHYTRCITQKCVTGWRAQSPHHCARATQLFLKKMSQRWRAVGDAVFDLPGPRFEPTRDERISARPTGRKVKIISSGLRQGS